ncbi:hypothetical protein FRB91_000865 [Serendipita sp. 411]|nr:hypothetical protein FRB91_000865 [Serendipita sp. 411]
MELQSAAERVPVEIWCDIFPLALETWLLPGDGGDILKSLLLFRRGCESVEEYARVENIRKSLRAVCRVWKDAVDSLSIDLTLSDFAANTAPAECYLPRSKRIEFLPGWSCHCRQCPDIFSIDPDRRQKEVCRLRKISPHKFAHTHSSLHPMSARIILLHLQRQDMAEYVHSAPCLAAFQGNICNIYRGEGLGVKAIFDRLTHLTLLALSPLEMKSAYQFPRLRFLAIFLNMGYSSKPPEDDYVALWRWRLPKLVSLVIRGAVSKVYREDLRLFLYSRSSTLGGLLLNYRDYTVEGFRAILAETNLFRRFSRLRTLGINIHTLGNFAGDINSDERETWRPRTTLPICETLLLEDIHNMIEFHPNRLQLWAQQCLWTCARPAGLFQRIIMVHSWDELGQLFENYVKRQVKYRAEGEFAYGFYPQLSFPRMFFQHIYEEPNIEFVDRNNVELREGNGITFWEKIRSMETDPGILGSDLDADVVAGRWRFRESLARET